MDIVAWIVVGFFAAVIAGVVTGRPAEGCLTKVGVGVLGALIGGALARAAGLKGLEGFGLRSILIAALGSSALLFTLGAIEGRGGARSVERGGDRNRPGRRSLP
ncbi:MAG: GlsB/YeaQ/YmgE family stress response membrane protein [Actinobacteria bacterium]|nr:GlsB/YeaQ/YmgE family stress response membrane protein [Actinomycetota bacterium]